MGANWRPLSVIFKVAVVAKRASEALVVRFAIVLPLLVSSSTALTTAPSAPSPPLSKPSERLAFVTLDEYGSASMAAARGARHRMASSESRVPSETSNRAAHCAPLRGPCTRCPMAKEHRMCVAVTLKLDPWMVTTVPPAEVPLDGTTRESVGGEK